MLRVLKVLLWLVVVVVVVVVGAYAFVPGSFLKNQAQQAIADATGREVTITELALKRWPPLGFTASGVTIANADWAEEPQLASVQVIDADVSVWSVITGAPSALVLTVQQPQIFIEIDEQGRGNFEFETASGEAGGGDGQESGGEPSSEGEGGGFELPVQPQIRIEDGLLVYRNVAGGIDRRFENINLAVTQEDETAPLLLSGNVDSNGQSATLDGTVASLDSLASGGESDIDVSLIAPGLDFALTGSVDPTAQRTNSNLDLQLANPRELADWLGQPLDIPEPALSNVSLTADIEGGAESVAVTNLVLQVDEIEGQGEVNADMAGERPSVMTRLTFGDVDLTPYLPEPVEAPEDEMAEAPAEEESAEPAAEGWPDEPLDLPLPLPADLDIDIDMASLTAPQLAVQNVKALVTADAETTRAQLVDLGLYEGTLNTTVSATAGEVPDFSVNLDTRNIALLPILSEFAQFERLEGTGNAAADLTTSGNSVKAIIDNLEGEGSVLLRDGAILGINVAAFMRRVMSLGLNAQADAPPRTDFAELGGTYTIAQGVLTNNDLHMRAPVLRLDGAGTVDLPQQSLDYRAEPQLAATLEGQDASGDALQAGVPIVITGPWADPQIQLDIGGDLTAAISNPANVGRLVEQLKTNPEMLKDLQEQFDLGSFGDVEEALEGVIGGALGGRLPGLGGGGGGNDPEDATNEAGEAGEAAGDAAEDAQEQIEEGVRGLLGTLGRGN